MKSFRNIYLTLNKCIKYRGIKHIMTERNSILIADKNIRSSKILREFLTYKGYDITLVDRWGYLLLEIKRRDISIIFLDVNLIGSNDGCNLIPMIRKIRPDIAIIITNNSNSWFVESKIRQHNILFYYIKPYDIKEISLILNNLFKEKLKEEVL